MPIYEYACQACGEETEIMQRMSDPPATECPHCHAEKLVKQVSAAGFRLKGAGWYETDFKQDKKRNLVGDTAPITSADPASENKPPKSAKPASESSSGSTSTTSASTATTAPATPAASTPNKTPTPS